MAKTAALIALALDYFTRYPESQECHITSEQRVFHTKPTAQANQPENGEVVSFNRNEVIAELKVTDASPEPGTTSALLLKDFDPEKTEYTEAKELLKSLGLKSASKSKEDIYAALLEAQKAQAAQAENTSDENASADTTSTQEEAEETNKQ